MLTSLDFRIHYTIVTRNIEDDTGNQYITRRTYKDIVDMYQYLDARYLMHGVIVPPPPPKESLNLIEKVQKEAWDDGERALSASKTLDKKCVALDRYMKRLFM